MPITRAYAQAAEPGNFFVAGKNKVINGDFGIWQRGTSFTAAAGGANVYSADRFYAQRDGTGATVTVSQQAFTAGSAPVAGYEGQFFYRFAQSVAGTGGTYNNFCNQKIEDVRTFANQTVTLSFWAKADAARTLTLTIEQNFGASGSASVYTGGGSVNVTTSWVRYSTTVNIPSISGKTIGANNVLVIYLGAPPNVTQTIDIWGVQLEAGAVATPFTTATGTLAGELAACQRYYEKSYSQATAPGTSSSSGFIGGLFSTAVGTDNNNYYMNYFPFKVVKRSSPTITIYDNAGNSGKTTAMALNSAGTNNITSYVSDIVDSAARVYVGQLDGKAGFIFHYVASAEL